MIDFEVLLELFAWEKLTEKLKWRELELSSDAVMVVLFVLYFVCQVAIGNLNE